MHKIPSPPQAFFDESGVNADDRVWDYGRACYALALSRGVPEPVWIVNDLGELGVMVAGTAYFLYKGDNIVYEDAAHDDGTPMLYRIVGKREFGETCWPLKWVEAGRREDRYTEKLHYAPGLSYGKPEDGDWRPLPKAAPAAAGAQGEDEIDRAARRMGDSARSLLQDIAQQAATKPAAADGGVRERAVELLAAEFKKAHAEGDEYPDAGECALRAISVALSSHRQAGDDQFRELAERWRANGHPYVSDCADELIALVEKGAGS